MIDNSTHGTPLIRPSLSNKLGFLLLTFVVALIFTGLLKGVIDNLPLDARNQFLVVSVAQSILAFIFPAVGAAFLFSGFPSGYLGLNGHISARELFGVITLMILIIPALNAVVFWNEHISLPEQMSGIELTMRKWENAAADTTSMLLSDTSVWGLVSGILVVGCLTGFAEESFFRGGIQKAFVSSGLNTHFSIWFSAFIFSAIHFQFFGFVPRLLLGALFGYLYNSSASLWIPSIAHCLNNSIVVAAAWLINRGLLPDWFDHVGADGPYAALLATSSLILSILFMCLFWKRIFKKRIFKVSVSKQDVQTKISDSNG